MTPWPPDKDVDTPVEQDKHVPCSPRDRHPSCVSVLKIHLTHVRVRKAPVYAMRHEWQRSRGNEPKERGTPGNAPRGGRFLGNKWLRLRLKIVRAGGYEEMTIRSLAAELGVAPMSLYRHVRDKDDILDEVVDRVLARAWRPSVCTGRLEGMGHQVADKLRRLLVRTTRGAPRLPSTSRGVALGDCPDGRHDDRAPAGPNR